MKTSDGILHEDWSQVHSLSLDVVNATALDEGSDLALHELFSFLSELEQRYGERPSLLATRADFTDDPIAAGEMLRRAFKLARLSDDFPNQWLIADSLFWNSIDKRQDKEEAKKWLMTMEELKAKHSFRPESLNSFEEAFIRFNQEDVE